MCPRSLLTPNLNLELLIHLLKARTTSQVCHLSSVVIVTQLAPKLTFPVANESGGIFEGDEESRDSPEPWTLPANINAQVPCG